MNEAELLFTGMLNCDRLQLYLFRDRLLDTGISREILSVLERRLKGEPIQYILGKTEFFGLEFKLNKNVFIPRPETEILVETALKQFSAFKLSDINILDLGTGSGCIAVCLARLLSNKNVHITATDISSQALNIAQENARINQVEDKITFLESDLFETLAQYAKRYTLCVCNPPYIRTQELNNLGLEIAHEPRIALDGGGDGLDFFRQIISNLGDYLEEEGLLITEIGFDQKDSLTYLFDQSKRFQIIEVIKDYNHLDRLIVARKI